MEIRCLHCRCIHVYIVYVCVRLYILYFLGICLINLHCTIYRMAGNFGGEFILQIGSFESNPPIFQSAKRFTVCCYICNHFAMNIIMV